MICCVQELRQAKAAIEAAKQELAEEGTAYATDAPVGIIDIMASYFILRSALKSSGIWHSRLYSGFGFDLSLDIAGLFAPDSLFYAPPK
jgi:hypothetical protein